MLSGQESWSLLLDNSKANASIKVLFGGLMLYSMADWDQIWRCIEVGSGSISAGGNWASSRLKADVTSALDGRGEDNVDSDSDYSVSA